ncbi:MAG TPA: DUF1003 domain-containing protein [Anaerolineaceae bacterium]
MQTEKGYSFGKYFEKTEGSSTLNSIIQENVQTILEYRKKALLERSLQDVIADRITDFSGRMIFVYVHAAWFAVWFLLNTGWFGIEPFDPFPYGLLTMVVSLEAIFLSTFVLISQNRMSEEEQQRAELDLQINLLTERELTRVLIMLDEIQMRMGITHEHTKELSELEKDTKPDEVLKLIETEKKNGEEEPQA